MGSIYESTATGKKRYFDDLIVGEEFSSRWLSADEDEMIEFARQFDPQYFNIDPEKA